MDPSHFVDLAPLATAAARRLLHMTRAPIEQVLREESRSHSELRDTEDAKEATAAFGGKRKSGFRGR